MLPATAVANWVSLMRVNQITTQRKLIPLLQGPINDLRTTMQAKIGTPAVTNTGGSSGTDATVSSGSVVDNPQGITWLSQFLEQAKAAGYTFDVLAFHWYAADYSDLLAQTSAMQALAKTYGIGTVIATEMGFNEASTEVGSFPFTTPRFPTTSEMNRD